MMDYGNPAISYVYEIVQTVEFVLQSNRTFRLEVVHCMKGTADSHYDVRYYERQTLYKAPNGTISTESVPNDMPFYVWVPDMNMPWVNQPSAEAALSQALDWLAERRNNQNKLW